MGRVAAVTDADGPVEHGPPYSGYENEIYFAGLAGQRPAFPLTYVELEAAAHDVLDDDAYGYVAGGASSGDTMRANLEAFRRWRIVPRHLRNVAERDLSVELFGARLPAPVLLAPVGVLSIIHEEAELAAARAVRSLGLGQVLSTVSSFSLEEVAEELGPTPRWFQLYWPADRALTESLLSRAEAAGYGAIVVTVDTRLLAWRPRDLAGAYLPFLRAEGIANYTSDEVFLSSRDAGVEDEIQASVLRWVQVFSDPSQTWSDLEWLCGRTELPVLVKGILHPDDARLALDTGARGIVVSNHGGRQVDGAIGALDALPGVVEEVADAAPVLFDSGVRTGADVVKAIALGARAVLVGRPYVWGLAVGGEDGVRHVLRSLLADLDLTIALSGATTLDELTPELLTEPK
ncbi:MAG: alpha-hydroxy-acid oxidizing protein [Nitriliruptorales bacterium]